MQVFGVCQLSELKGWRRGSPDNQAAIRRAAVDPGGIAGRRTPYHGPAAHIGRAAIAHMPFPVEAIQVDGGYEFKDEFEQACQAKGIRPYELPPTGRRSRRPRALLWIMRYEFYACYELPRSVEALIQYSKSLQHLYNQYRPHGALAGQTPASYLKER